MDLSTINDFYESIKTINKKVDSKRLNSPGTMNIAEIMNRQILTNNLLSPFSVGGYSV